MPYEICEKNVIYWFSRQSACSWKQQRWFMNWTLSTCYNTQRQLTRTKSSPNLAAFCSATSTLRTPIHDSRYCMHSCSSRFICSCNIKNKQVSGWLVHRCYWRHEAFYAVAPSISLLTDNNVPTFKPYLFTVSFLPCPMVLQLALLYLLLSIFIHMTL